MTRLVATFLSMLLLSQLAGAKRIAPVSVEPIVYEGTRYVAPNDQGRRGYIQAWDVATNKKLWELTIFTNRIDPNLEEDVQWVFINALRVQDGRVLVTSERGNIYQVDPSTKTITQPHSQTSRASDTTRELPGKITKALTKALPGRKYTVSFRTNPSYLEGDFNGDGTADVAILVKEHSTGKLGIAIIDGAAGRAAILGAGVGIGNGGDDFEWIDSWQVYSKARATGSSGESNVSHLRGDALLVEKREAASALIYWNGKRFVWSQQSD